MQLSPPRTSLADQPKSSIAALRKPPWSEALAVHVVLEPVRLTEDFLRIGVPRFMEILEQTVKTPSGLELERLEENCHRLDTDDALP
jgi:hypothetical protein